MGVVYAETAAGGRGAEKTRIFCRLPKAACSPRSSSTPRWRACTSCACSAAKKRRCSTSLRSAESCRTRRWPFWGASSRAINDVGLSADDVEMYLRRIEESQPREQPRRRQRARTNWRSTWTGCGKRKHIRRTERRVHANAKRKGRHGLCLKRKTSSQGLSSRASATRKVSTREINDALEELNFDVEMVDRLYETLEGQQHRDRGGAGCGPRQLHADRGERGRAGERAERGGRRHRRPGEGVLKGDRPRAPADPGGGDRPRP